MTDHSGGCGPRDVDACSGSNMGNDITPPSSTHDTGQPAHSTSTTAGSWGDARSFPHGVEGARPAQVHGNHAPASPAHTDPGRTGDVSFTEIARFRDLPPLKAARSYARRASDSAERAQWECGVARQALASGELQFAKDVADDAVRHANSAQFFLSLMEAALTQWQAKRHPAPLSIGLENLVGRARSSTADARSTADDIDVLVTNEYLRAHDLPPRRRRTR